MIVQQGSKAYSTGVEEDTELVLELSNPLLLNLALLWLCVGCSRCPNWLNPAVAASGAA